VIKRLFAKALGVLAVSVTAVQAQPNMQPAHVVMQPAPVVMQPAPVVMQPAPALVQPMPTRTSTGTINTPVVVRTLAADPAKPEKIGTPTTITAPYQDACGNCCGQRGGSIWFEAEALFLKYHRADGVDSPNATQDASLAAEFDYNLCPRITAGVALTDTLGVRLRYWSYEEESSLSTVSAVATNQFFIHLDTYNVDLEVFDVFALNCNWELELAGGIRYNDFFEQYRPNEATSFAPDYNQFNSLGGMVSAEVRRKVCGHGALFARVRYVVLVDDHEVAFNSTATNPFTMTDVIHSQMELALGGLYLVPVSDKCKLLLRASLEWQEWREYDQIFQFNGASTVGFFGFGFSAGVVY
jgi:hypothetical protein